ncbi:MAG: Ig-like domain-containing protein [Porticoccaceae bacterium]
MNIGLILFVSSLLLGNTGDKSTNTANENQPRETIASQSTKTNNSSFDEQLSDDSVQVPANFTTTEALSNYSLSISGNAETKIKQNEYYAFTPFVDDLNNDKLQFSISNKPIWANFDSRTGSLSGQPTNWDVGITKDIIVSVSNSKGDLASMVAFDIEVLNVNDKPMISGIPSPYYMPLKAYRFKPTVRDIDMDINKDKLWFTIENKPHWATFNNKNGELSGKPKFSEDDNNLDIIISVTDSYGLSAALKPFRVDVSALQLSILYKSATISKKENIPSYLNISYGFFDYSKVIKSVETIESYSKTSTSINQDQENHINHSTNSESKLPNIKITETAKKELKTKIIKHNDPPGEEIAENNNQIRIESIKYQNIEQNRPLISQSTESTLKFTETSIIEDKKTSPKNIGSIKQPKESNPVVANKQTDKLNQPSLQYGNNLDKSKAQADDSIHIAHPDVTKSANNPKKQYEIADEQNNNLAATTNQQVNHITKEIQPSPQANNHTHLIEADTSNQQTQALSHLANSVNQQPKISENPTNNQVDHKKTGSTDPPQPSQPVNTKKDSQLDQYSITQDNSNKQTTSEEVDSPNNFYTELQPPQQIKNDNSQVTTTVKTESVVTVTPPPKTPDNQGIINKDNVTKLNDTDISQQPQPPQNNNSNIKNNNNSQVTTTVETEPVFTVAQPPKTPDNQDNNNRNNVNKTDDTVIPQQLQLPKNNNSNINNNNSQVTTTVETESVITVTKPPKTADNQDNNNRNNVNKTDDTVIPQQLQLPKNNNSNINNNNSQVTTTVETEPVINVTQPPKTSDNQDNNNRDNVNKTDDTGIPQQIQLPNNNSNIKNNNSQVTTTVETEPVVIVTQPPKTLDNQGNNPAKKINTQKETDKIQIVTINIGPVIASKASTSIKEGQIYQYEAQVTDSDDSNNGTDLIWTLSNAPLGMQVSNKGVVTWIPKEGITSSGEVILSVADGGENGASAATQTFTVSVVAVNDAPSISSTAPTSTTEDIKYTYTAKVIDPDDSNNGTDLIWTLTNAPPDMQVSSKGVVTWIPKQGITSSGEVILSVADGGENGATAAAETFTVSVVAVNDPPSITSTAPTSATEDIKYTYTAKVIDPDDSNNGTDLIWTLSNAPPDMQVSNTGVISWTPTEGITSSGLVILSVKDGGEDGAKTHAEEFTINVEPVDDPPELKQIDPIEIDEDSGYRIIDLEATDIDNKDSDIEFTARPSEYSKVEVDLSPDNPKQLRIRPLANVHSTSVDIKVTAISGGKEVSETFNVSIRPVNDAPEAYGKEVAAEENKEKSISLEATDFDHNKNELTYKIIKAPNGEYSLDPSTGVVTYTSISQSTMLDESGNIIWKLQDNFIYEVCDSSNACSSPAIVIIGIEQTNDRPTVVSISPERNRTIAEEGVPYSYKFEIKDPDFYFSADKNSITIVRPQWMDYSLEYYGDYVRGELYGTPQNKHIGIANNEVIINVKDGRKEQDEFPADKFTISVSKDINYPPYALDQSIVVNEKSSQLVTMNGTDPDGDQLFYSIVKSPDHGLLESFGEDKQTLKYTHSSASPNNDEDIFTYIACDRKANNDSEKKCSALARVDVKINHQPIAFDQTIERTDGQQITIKLIGEDKNGDDLRYEIVENGVTKPLPNNSYSYTATYSRSSSEKSLNQDSQDFIRYRVCDETLCSKIATVTVDIKPKNYPPVFAPIADQEIQEDTVYFKTFIINDPDSSQLTFTVKQGPDWLKIYNADNPDNSGSIDLPVIEGKAQVTLRGTTTNQQVGKHSIELTVTDDSNPSVEQPFTLTVEVRTIYSKYRKNLNSSDSSAELRPLLFKGNNPFIGKVDGKNYWIGYPN